MYVPSRAHRPASERSCTRPLNWWNPCWLKLGSTNVPVEHSCGSSDVAPTWRLQQSMDLHKTNQLNSWIPCHQTDGRNPCEEVDTSPPQPWFTLTRKEATPTNHIAHAGSQCTCWYVKKTTCPASNVALRNWRVGNAPTLPAVCKFRTSTMRSTPKPPRKA